MEEKIITWSNVNDVLLQEFPVLRKERYAALIGGFDGWRPGQYVVFGSPFNKYLEDAAANGTYEDQSKIGLFLETLSNANNDAIGDLLSIEVLPTLFKSQAVLNTYWRHLGIQTQRKVRILATRLAPLIDVPPESALQ